MVILPLISKNMATEATKEDVFMRSIQFVLGNWPVIRLSVDQCFGGQYSREKELWLQEVLFNVFMENGSLDPLDIEDYLGEILCNEFNIMIEDDSLPKVAEKLCSYHQLCKKGEHLKVVEEMNSVTLPRMDIKCKDDIEDNERQSQFNNGISEQFEDLNLNTNDNAETGNPGTDNGSDNCHDNSVEDDDGWMLVQRGRKKK